MVEGLIPVLDPYILPSFFYNRNRLDRKTVPGTILGKKISLGISTRHFTGNFFVTLSFLPLVIYCIFVLISFYY